MTKRGRKASFFVPRVHQNDPGRTTERRTGKRSDTAFRGFKTQFRHIAQGLIPSNCTNATRTPQQRREAAPKESAGSAVL